MYFPNKRLSTFILVLSIFLRLTNTSIHIFWAYSRPRDSSVSNGHCQDQPKMEETHMFHAFLFFFLWLQFRYTPVCAGQLIHVFIHKHGLSPQKRSILSVWSYCITKCPYTVSLLLLQSPKSNGFDVYVIFFYTDAELAIWKGSTWSHGGARGDPVQSAMRMWKCQPPKT